MNIAGVFDKAAMDYDETRKKYISCFDDFYGIAIEQIPYSHDDEFDILDLGAGTGLFSSLVKNVYPLAQITLTDISEPMLHKARERFGDNTRLKFIQNDYINEDIPGKYDVVISALSLHHSTPQELLSVFRKLSHVLKDGGLFINADQILGDTPEIEQAYERAWLSQAIANGCTDQEIQVALKRMEADRTLPLKTQLELLQQAGFSNINCWYQYYRYVVYSARSITDSF